VSSRLAADRGESLIEILVAMLIMGIVVVAVMGGLLTSVKVSDIHRKQATAGADVRSYVEGVKRAVAAGGYKPCAASSDYLPVPGTAAAAVHFVPHTGFTASVVKVEYWTDTGPGTPWSWASSCSPDWGLQRVTLQVQSDDGRATEQSVVVLRAPCGPAVSTC
jgi:type II secretory pathway pseudopilin PulG